MSRRILKFRAWNTERKFMEEMDDDPGFIRWGYWGDCIFDPDYTQWEIMQFTGLSDKTGKEIYESDVVKIDNDGSDPICLVTNPTGWCFQMNQINEPDFEWTRQFHQPDRLEIIGNIHESPELLN